MSEFILGIESSCDDTSVGIANGRQIMANVTANQEIHREFGGVVPELASRAHQQNIIPVVNRALTDAIIQPNQLSAIAFTSGPGLLGSLLVGASFAKSMAMSLKVPLIEVNHMQAHILAHFIEKPDSASPQFPFLCLTVSGGHTQIVKVKNYFDYELLGQTIDDAAGEAFDKAAKIMGLPYPGGPVIDEKALSGDATKFEFARPRVDAYDYSFSGLKTSILYFLQKQVKLNPGFIAENEADLCASIQWTIVAVLMEKLVRAAKDHQIKQIAIAGGVSANSELRKAMAVAALENDWQTFIPDFEYCTDNGAMVAITAHFKYQTGHFSKLSTVASARKHLTCS